MGVKLSWIAIKDVPKDKVLAWMSLSETADPGEPMTSDLCGAQIGKWYVVSANDLEFAKEENLFNLSDGCDVLGGRAEELEANSQLVMYKDRQFVWRVEYWGYEGPDPDALETDGAPPPEFDSIRAEKLAMQKVEPKDSQDDHLYDVPLELCRRLCGFHYDPDGPKPAFKKLKDLTQKAGVGLEGSWFKRVFGK